MSVEICLSIKIHINNKCTGLYSQKVVTLERITKIK